MTTAPNRATWRPLFLGALVAFAPLWAKAQTADSVFKTVKVGERAYALVGELTQRSPSNLGNNMTGGFIVADDGVVVIDSGGSKAGAEVIVQAVRAVTDKHILWVVNSGGQDHRWLGNDHFQKVVGARVIASDAGKQDQKARTFQQLDMAQRNVGERFAGTVAAYPDETFSRRYRLPVKGVQIDLIDVGGAHTPADLIVWLPQERIAFAGDVVFHERLLGIQPGLGLKWIAALKLLRDDLKPLIVVPGHGRPGPPERVIPDSLGYLEMLRDGAKNAFKAGAFDPVEAASAIDQSAFSDLERTVHYVSRVGLDYVKKRILEDAEGRKALWEQLQFALDGEPDPWFDFEEAAVDTRQFEELPS